MTSTLGDRIPHTQKATRATKEKALQEDWQLAVKPYSEESRKEKRDAAGGRPWGLKKGLSCSASPIFSTAKHLQVAGLTKLPQPRSAC